MLKELEAEKPRMWVKKWVARREKLGVSNNLLKEMALKDAGVYRNVLRIGLEKFEELLSMITPKLGKKDSVMRMAIPCRTKLEITLRYMATGDSFRSLALLFRVPHNTISAFLPDAMVAIYASHKASYPQNISKNLKVSSAVHLAICFFAMLSPQTQKLVKMLLF